MIVAAVIVSLIGWVLGYSYRALDRSRRDAEDVAQAARQAAAGAREAERRVLATELHDVVARDLTAITMLSASWRLRSEDGTAAAFGTVETTARSALDDLQRLLAVLRSSEVISPPSSSGEQLSVPQAVDRLRARLEALGWSVDTEVSCTPLPTSVANAVNRVLEEAAANAVKHNGATRISLRVRDTDEGVEVVVRNRLSSPPAATVRPTHMGLAGLRERVGLLDGRLEVGRSGDDWVVSATLPRHAAPGL